MFFKSLLTKIIKIGSLWPPCWIGQATVFLSCGFYLSSFFLAYSHRSEIRCPPYFCTWCGLSANWECRSEMCCTRLAGNTRRENDAKNRHLRTIAQLYRAVSSQLRHIILTIGKNLLNSNMSSTCFHNMANFDLLTADIGSEVWGHSSSGRQPNFAASYKEIWNIWTFAQGATYIRQGGHHVGHRPTF